MNDEPSIFGRFLIIQLTIFLYYLDSRTLPVILVMTSHFHPLSLVLILVILYPRCVRPSKDISI